MTSTEGSAHFNADDLIQLATTFEAAESEALKRSEGESQTHQQWKVSKVQIQSRTAQEANTAA